MTDGCKLRSEIIQLDSCKSLHILQPPQGSLIEPTENLATPEDDVLPLSPKRRMVVTIGVLLGMMISSMEITIVGTALPTVIATLGGLQHYSWVFSAYLITSTVTVPVWGKLSDLYGRRPIYQIGIALFLLGSMLSGMAASMTQLIIFRALQGLGAGALVPMAMTIIGDIYTLRERARMQAVFSSVWGFSSIVGPLIGGFLTDQLSWRWVFFINIPIGIAAAIIIGYALVEPRLHKNPRIDYAGAATLMLSVTTLMLVLVEASSFASLVSPRNVALLLVTAALLLLFVRIEKSAPHAIMPLELFSNRTVSVAIVAAFFSGMAMFGAISFIPLFAQGTLGATATEAGSMLTPMMLTWVALSVVGSRLLLHVGFRPVALSGLGLMALGFVLFSQGGANTPRSWLYAYLIVIGAGMGLTMLTLVLAMQNAVSRPQLGITTSLNQFARTIGGAVGVAIMGAVLSAGLSTHLLAAAHTPGSPLTPKRAVALAANPDALIDHAARASMPTAFLQVLEDALSSSLHSVFWMCAALSALGFLVALKLPTGHRTGAPEESAL
jgi:EmrB/QacA subfamily drug resistance transporter